MSRGKIQVPVCMDRTTGEDCDKELLINLVSQLVACQKLDRLSIQLKVPTL